MVLKKNAEFQQRTVVIRRQEESVAENFDDQNYLEKTEETGLSCFGKSFLLNFEKKIPTEKTRSS